MTQGADFLAGVRVLELGDGVAGAAAGGLLWSLGADVVSVIDPMSAHRRGQPSVRAGRAASLLSIVLDRGKRIVEAGPGPELVDLLEQGREGARFDVVIADVVLGRRGPRRGVSRRRVVRSVRRGAQPARG